MFDDLADGLSVLFAIILFAITMAALVAGAAVHWRTERAIMQQAFERGYAVQCVGKTGYHWECGE